MIDDQVSEARVSVTFLEQKKAQVVWNFPRSGRSICPLDASLRWPYVQNDWPVDSYCRGMKDKHHRFEFFFVTYTVDTRFVPYLSNPP